MGTANPPPKMITAMSIDGPLIHDGGPYSYGLPPHAILTSARSNRSVLGKLIVAIRPAVAGLFVGPPVRRGPLVVCELFGGAGGLFRWSATVRACPQVTNSVVVSRIVVLYMSGAVRLGLRVECT